MKRKEAILAETKDKLEACEISLKSFGASLDNQLKVRLESSTHGYIPNENINTHPGPSILNTPSFDSETSADINVIVLKD